jgi:glycosyltransferase involved in cell wall biosynthesis
VEVCAGAGFVRRMKVSVLIPAFQAAPYILGALESVRAQSHSDWEIFVVEDGSHDGTKEIVETFAATTQQPVHYRNLGSNYGVGTARNRLLELSTGEALAFIDADDTWESSHLELAVNALRSKADVVVSGVRTFDLKSGATREKVEPPPELIRDPVLTLFRSSVIITSSSVVLTKELADRTGQFDPTLRIGEDRDYWLRCALEGARFHVTGACTCNYAKHQGSSMARTTLVAEQTVQFYDKYRSLPEVALRVRRRHRANSLISLGRLLRRQDPRRSAACFWKAWHCEPFNPRIPFHLAFTRWRSIGSENAA